MAAYKRSNPAQIRKNIESIIKDIEDRQEETDQYAPVSPPVVEGAKVTGSRRGRVRAMRRGSEVTGFKKGNTTA